MTELSPKWGDAGALNTLAKAVWHSPVVLVARSFRQVPVVTSACSSFGGTAGGTSPAGCACCRTCDPEFRQPKPEVRCGPMNLCAMHNWDTDHNAEWDGTKEVTCPGCFSRTPKGSSCSTS